MNNQWNLKQSVADKIMSQFEASTTKERRALIVKLLEQVRPEFLVALDFAYEMAPAPRKHDTELDEIVSGMRTPEPSHRATTEQALDYQAQESQDETGTHAPNCRCPWCSSEEV